jgi:FkbM family methyltransferase
MRKWLEEYPPVNGKPTYQFRKFAEALIWTRPDDRGVAYDVGAHVGLWTMHLLDYFDFVKAYEPIAEYRECFKKNCHNLGSWFLRNVGCSDKHEYVNFDHAEGFSGCTWVDGEGDIELVRIDDDGVPESITFMKFDCEGYEYFAIKGAEETIRTWQPCILVEQKPGNAEKYGLDRYKALELLRSWGAKQRAEDCGDFIYSWD